MRKYHLFRRWNIQVQSKHSLYSTLVSLKYTVLLSKVTITCIGYYTKLIALEGIEINLYMTDDLILSTSSIKQTNARLERE